MKVIVYMQNSELHRVIPVINTPVESCVNAVPEGVDFKILENDDMPEGNREAWVLEGDKVVIDETKIVKNGE